MLVRLRELFDSHDALYSPHAAHLLNAPRRISTKNPRRANLSARPQLKVSDGGGNAEEAEEHLRVITIAAVLIRLRPFSAINGSLTLTSTRLIFLPDLQDPQVRKLGATSLQVDLPSVNIRGVRRVKADDLDLLIDVDVGLSLQENQRFLQVLYKPDISNIVASSSLLIPTRAGYGAAVRRLTALDEDCSLYFMMSPESLSLARTKLVQRMEEATLSSGDGVPALVGVSDNPIPTTQDLLQLRPYIPLMFRSCKQWFLRFCTRKDGISMSTLMHRVEDVAPLLLFVRTTAGECFGVYIGDELVYCKEYYGSDRTFVFRLGDAFSVWTATPQSRYFLLLTHDGLSIGADSLGNLCLFIDSELSAGETHRSEAFDNDPLIGSGYQFQVSSIEIYSFEPPETD